MKSPVGLRSYFGPLDSLTLKRDALLFKRIGVPLLNSASFRPERLAPELTWLRDQGIVYDPMVEYPGVILPSSKNDAILFEATLNALGQLLKDRESFNKHTKPLGLPEVTDDDELRGAALMSLATFTHEFSLRQLGIYMRDVHKVDATPIQQIPFDDLSKFLENATPLNNKSTVVHVVIKSLPVPDESVSWEQVLDFRSDPDSEGKLLGLRVWMNEAANAKLSPIDIEQKIEWLIHDYEQHMKFHRMKANIITFETLISSLAESAMLKFGKLTKGLFSIKQRKVALLEGELKSPGREIAFISKARNRFRQ